MQKPAMKWIGTDGDFYPDRRDRAGNQYKPIAIVCHIMQGTLVGTDQEFNNPARDASTHFGVGPKGELHQYVELKDGSWGNGLLQKPDLSVPWIKDCVQKSINPNLRTISIEHEGTHPDMDAGKFWTPTEAQIQATTQLIAWLCWTYGIAPSAVTIVGHFQIDNVDRHFCPGPNFPFQRIIKDAAALLAKEAAALFSDLQNHWAKDSVERLAAHKLADGTPIVKGRLVDGQTLFQPDDNITRAEVAVLLDRVLLFLGK